LLGHQAAYREQGILQAFEKECQADDHENHADGHARRVFYLAAQYERLEAEQDQRDGQDVPQHAQQGRAETDHRIHQYSIPKPITKIMGVNEAKAISPKPSISGSRP